MKYDKNTIIDTAMQIIRDEHAFFVKEGNDNSEHIPQIIRIAESAGKLLSVSGMNKEELNGNINRIIQFGRQLFVDEWMRPLDGDSEPPREQDAIDEFNRHLTKKKETSNQALQRTTKRRRSRQR
jgi:hypothetical protein